MKKSNAVLGLTLAFISTVAYSIVFVFSKAALNQVNLTVFGVYWYTIATIETGVYFFGKRLYKQFAGLKQGQKILVIVIAILEVIGTVLFFLSIKLFRHPAAVSFIGTLIPVFVGILSFIFLHERFNFLESVGIVLTIVGAAVISYQSTVLGEITRAKLGLAAAFVFILIFSLNTVLMRISVQNAHPAILSFFRALFLLVFWVAVALVTKQNLKIPAEALKNIVIGATLGPFIGLMANIFALKYIEATITSVFINTKGFLILIIAYFYLHLVPEPYQIVGGVIAVVGVALMSYGKYKKEHSNNKRLVLS